MEKFKVGDKVRELATGDIGIIVESPYNTRLGHKDVWVKWGGGSILWIHEDDIEFINTEKYPIEILFMNYLMSNPTKFSNFSINQMNILKEVFEAGYNSKE